MTRPPDRKRLEELERQIRERELPLPEPAILALQRTAGNRAVARTLMRRPNLTVTDRQTGTREVRPF
jgi:hypothetical protein